MDVRRAFAGGNLLEENDFQRARGHTAVTAAHPGCVVDLLFTSGDTAAVFVVIMN